MTRIPRSGDHGTRHDDADDRSTDVLRLQCVRHDEPHKNKAELRALLGSLLADARENAAAHAATLQHELPLADRRRVHVPTNLQARGKRSRSPRATSAAWGPPLHQG